MPKGASARRYAQAVFELATENDELDKWLEDLALLSDALGNEEFSLMLDSPQITEEQKVNVINEGLGESVGPLAINLISLLATRISTHLLPEITEVFQEMLDQHRGIERAEVISAVALDDGQQQQVADLLKNMVGKEIRLTTRVEPSILGGIVARVGDRVIDGSARTKLDELRRELVHAS